MSPRRFLAVALPSALTLLSAASFLACATHRAPTEAEVGAAGVGGEAQPIELPADEDFEESAELQGARPSPDAPAERKQEMKKAKADEYASASAADEDEEDAPSSRAKERDIDDGPVAVREEARTRAPTARPMPTSPAKTAMGRASGVSGGAAQGTVAYAPPMTVAPPPPPVPPTEVVSSSEDYHDYGVNPFTMVSEDRLSTFSIDVDTASYAMSRRKLQEESILPVPAGVRVEEYVNYFKYDYQKPSADPFAVSMEAMPDPFRAGHHILRVGVQGKELSRAERPAVHLTFLVDVSGSMASPDKLGLAQQSLHLLVDGLREDDTVALATYAGRVAKILEPTSAGEARTIHRAIDQLSAGGSTAMSAGIDLAYALAEQGFEPGHENRVIVLSDGDANVGNTSWDDLLGQIKGHADKGVTLSTIGFGMGNYKDTLMEQLANKGDGNNYYIDGKEQAERVFVQNLGGTMLTIARDVKIQVEFDPSSVAAYRLVGYENRDVADKDFRNDRVDAGEVGSGHQVTALYDVVLKEGYSPTLATVRMRWEKPGADSTATERSFRFGDQALKETPSLASRDTRIAYTSATFAEILRGSPQAAEIDLGKLIAFGKAASRSGQKDDAELVALMEKAKALGAGGNAGFVSRR